MIVSIHHTGDSLLDVQEQNDRVIYSLLKIASYGFAWMAPIVILVGVSRWIQTRFVQIVKQRLIWAILVPVVWLIGLIGSFVGQAFHESAWHSANPNGVVTEKDMVALGDYPQVFIGWVLLGWIPVVTGLVLSVRRNRNRQAQL